jgi:hypothetical protein
MQVQQYLPFQGNNPTANDVTTASIPSTAGATAISALSATDTDVIIKVIPFPLYQPMEH